MTSGELRDIVARHKWLFDVGRGDMQSYVNPGLRIAGIVAGAILTARAGPAAASAWIASLPLWMGAALGGLYLLTCYAVGRVHADLTELLRAESRAALQANDPMRQVLSRFDDLEARLTKIEEAMPHV